MTPFQNQEEFIPKPGDISLLYNIYPEWDHPDFSKPYKYEVESVLRFCRKIDFISSHSDNFKEILEADIFMKDDQKTTDEKFNMLVEKLEDKNINELCKTTLYNFITEVFKVDRISLQIFRLYKKYLPEHSDLIDDIFINSWYIAPTSLFRYEEEYKPINNFCRDIIKIDFKKFKMQLKSCPKFSDLINKGFNFEYYESSRDLSLISIYKTNIFVRTIKFNEWRNLSEPIYHDHNIRSVYGAYQLIWSNLIKDKTDLNTAIDLGIFDKMDYDSFRRFTYYIKFKELNYVSKEIYDFIISLNFECLDILPHEDNVWVDILRNTDVNQIIPKKIVTNTKNTVKILLNRDYLNDLEFNITELIKLRNKIKDDAISSENLIQVFQSCILFCEIEDSFINKMLPITNKIVMGLNMTDISYVSNCLTDIMGSFLVMYHEKHKNINLLSSIKKYKMLDIPSLAKLKGSDFYIQAQDALELDIENPIHINETTITLFPIDNNSMKWAIKHLDNNNIINHLLQLYFHIIPEKESFIIACDSRILSNFTWEKWNKMLLNRDSEKSIPIFLVDDCERLRSNFYNYWKSLHRDLRNKIIYDPISLYFGLIGLIFAFTGVVQMILAVISLKLQLATS